MKSYVHPLDPDIEMIGSIVVQSAFNVHYELGPGLLEKVYEGCLEYEIKKAGLICQRQVKIPVYYDGQYFDEGMKLDLLIENKVIVEIKAVDQVNPVWKAQLISHLKLTNLQLGYLINFNVPLIKNGIQRFRNDHFI